MHTTHPPVSQTEVAEALYTLNVLRGVPYPERHSTQSPMFHREYYVERRVDPVTNKQVFQIFEFLSNSLPVPVFATGWTTANDLFRHVFTYIQGFQDGNAAKKLPAASDKLQTVFPIVFGKL